MNVVQLQYFIKVFDCQNYSDAATILSVSPQAVSKGIRALESELGLKLFEKKRQYSTSNKLWRGNPSYSIRCTSFN